MIEGLLPWAMQFAGPFAFAITFAENWVSSKERVAERNARTSNTRKWSLISANWSTVFEVILLIDILLTVAEPLAIFPWVVAGGWLGQFLVCEKTRRKFQAKKFRKGGPNPSRRKRKRTQEQGDALGNGAGDGSSADASTASSGGTG